MGTTPTDLRPSPTTPLTTPPYHKKLQMFLSTTKSRDLYRDPGPAFMLRSGRDGGGEVPADLCATKLTFWPLNVVNGHLSIFKAHPDAGRAVF
jgi:hypothetical protein